MVSGGPGQLNPKFVPWQVTLLVEGNIEISGNPVMKNYEGSTVGSLAVPEAVRKLLLIAGLDLKINGNATTENAGAPTEQYFQGIMAAHEQVTISGNPTLGGVILAENAQNLSSTAKDNSISGNMRLIPGGDLVYPGVAPGKPSRVAWRDIEKINP